MFFISIVVMLPIIIPQFSVQFWVVALCFLLTLSTVYFLLQLLVYLSRVNGICVPSTFYILNDILLLTCGVLSFFICFLSSFLCLSDCLPACFKFFWIFWHHLLPLKDHRVRCRVVYNVKGEVICPMIVSHHGNLTWKNIKDLGKQGPKSKKNDSIL